MQLDELLMQHTSEQELLCGGMQLQATFVGVCACTMLYCARCALNGKGRGSEPKVISLCQISVGASGMYFCLHGMVWHDCTCL
jgi:hypothetical protein